MKRPIIRLMVAMLVTIVAAVALALPASADTYSDRVLADNPSLYWRLNEPSGTSFADSSGNGKNGTFIPWDVSSAPLHYGLSGVTPTDAAVFFDDSGQIRGNGGDVVPPSNTFTMEVWIKTTSNAGGWIGGFGEYTSGYHDRFLFMDNAGHIGFSIYSDGNGPSMLRTGGTYNDGEWHMVTATLDGTGQRLYVDGVLNQVDTAVTTAQVYSGNWSLGCRSWDSDYWSGPGTVTLQCSFARLDEFAVWESTALTPTQIAGHYAEVMNRSDVAAKVDPSLTFSVSGRATACNGATPTVGSSSSGSSANLGRISATATGIASQDLFAATNAANGFVIGVQSSGALNDGNGHDIAAVPWTYDGRGPSLGWAPLRSVTRLDGWDQMRGHL